MAEAVFAHVLKQRDLIINGLLTARPPVYLRFTGSLPDSRAITVLLRHVIETEHKARQLCRQDFDKYDYIFCMDNNNIEDINDIKPENSKAIVEMLGKYDTQKQTIIESLNKQKRDKGFETNYELCLRCCNAFLDQFHK
ncbi:low molecular weight phosphotyrosine protein phosphatase-like [Oppia nitens]|uniref:low molecular weight phosphotyrosine protein phosphatase-like n=1 Tax=Oppia nitens TaxID=1686743 RepID=UPI0023DB72B7|nr:low molecular weight phosphotyrosine protein phosphatase-like [Oppia nitens]